VLEIAEREAMETNTVYTHILLLLVSGSGVTEFIPVMLGLHSCESVLWVYASQNQFGWE
jgi:ferredoxin-NADP reductase